MLQIKPQNIIPITDARSKLDDLVTDAVGNNFFVISRQGKAKAALIDVEYILNLQKKLDQIEMEQLQSEMQQSFKKYLKKKGVNPETLTDKEAENYLADLSS